jgi:hypothetical protein
LNAIGLGLTLWEGRFEEEVTRLWLRWCDREGAVIPTGAERAEAESQGREVERLRAEAESQGREVERLRAEVESQRAEAESQAREIERQRADRLAERLRAMGINPDEI